MNLFGDLTSASEPNDNVDLVMFAVLLSLGKFDVDETPGKEGVITLGVITGQSIQHLLSIFSFSSLCFSFFFSLSDQHLIGRMRVGYGQSYLHISSTT